MKFSYEKIWRFHFLFVYVHPRTKQNGCAYYMGSFWHENTLITQPIFDIEIIGNIHDNPELLESL